MVFKRFITILSMFFICNVSIVFADEIKGVIIDKENQKGIMGAIVYIKNAKNVPIQYCSTDKNGNFTINYDSSKAGLTLEANLLGYKPVTFTPPFPTNIRIELEISPQQIQEVVVKASKVKQSGDTIKYTVPALLSQNDRTLGDVLKKLPGISVTKDGFIRYQGRSINKLYIDGHDILEDKYNLATKNIDPKMLKEIDIYEDHQPIRALEGVIESNTAALNIVLKEGAKSKWLGNAQGSVGGSTKKPYVPYSASVWIMNIGKKYQTINSLQTDAAGNDISGPINTGGIVHNLYDYYYTPKTYTRISHVSAPLEEKRTKFNTSYAASTNHKFTVYKNLKMGVSGNYYNEALKSESSTTEIYDMQNGTTNTFTELNKVNTNTHHGSAEISAELNTSKVYFKDNLKFNISRDRSSNNLGGTTQVDEQNQTGKVNIKNDISFISTGKKRKRSFSFTMITHYVDNFEKMGITSSEGDTANQTINGKHFYNDFQFNYSKKFAKHFTFSSYTNLQFLNRKFKTSLIGNTFENDDIRLVNDIHLWYLKGVEALDLEYKRNRFKANLNVDLWYQYINTIQKHAFAANPNLTIKYDFSARLSGELGGSFSRSSLNEQQLFSGLIMNSYKYLVQGKNDLVQNPNYSLFLNLDFRYPTSGWYFKLNTQWQASKSFISTRYFIDNYIVNKYTNNFTDYSNLDLNFELSKALFGINGKATVIIGGSRVETDINQNEIKTNYIGYTGTTNLSLIMTPASWIGLEYSGEYLYTKYKTAGVWDPNDNHSLFETLSINFFITPQIELMVGAEHYFSKYSGEKAQQTIFLDASAWYFITKKFQIYLRAKNLLNQHSYSFTYLNPLQTTHSSHTIRPLNVLLGFQLNF